MTYSTVVVHAGEHLFKVVGHSQITASNTRLTSDTFRVSDHDWAILYYPNGDVRVAGDQVSSIFLKLMNAGEDEVTASYSFCLQDPAAPATTGEKHKHSFGAAKFTSTKPSLGTDKFVSKADLAASGCLKDDCLVIKCTVEVPELIHRGNNDDNNIVVPSSSLGTDLRYLLESGLKADLTVKIGSPKSFKLSRRKAKSFKVHACLLASRSPVFRAQLCGSMKESKQSSICIKGMDARVFEVLLHYMYTDCLPEFMEETTDEAANMARNLLVAADRYAMERLKLMCESKLSKALVADTVCFTLDLAQQYNCQQLKDSCLKYMATDRERLRAIKKTEGFEQLKKKHPSIVSDILDQVIEKLN